MIFVETEPGLGGRAERTPVREHGRQRPGEGIGEKHRPPRRALCAAGWATAALWGSVAAAAPNRPVHVAAEPASPCLDEVAFERALFARITRPRGKPPTPRAISSPNDPVEMAGTSAGRSSVPSFMMAPFPYCFSIWERANSNARFLSSFSDMSFSYRIRRNQEKGLYPSEKRKPRAEWWSVER